jgi:hypothetical protein
VNQFSPFYASHAADKLAALAQALIIVSSVNSPDLHEHPEHLEEDLSHCHVSLPSRFFTPYQG